MANQERWISRERIGKTALYGGIIAGMIGLFASGQWIVAGALLAGGGYMMAQTGKRQHG